MREAVGRLSSGRRLAVHGRTGQPSVGDRELGHDLLDPGRCTLELGENR